MAENFTPNTAAKEEEAFASAVDTARKDGGMFGGKEAAEKAAERGDAPAPASADQDGGATAAQRTRDETGRFAKEPPPFEGYDKLDPEARKYIDRLTQERKRDQNRAQDAQRRLAQAQSARPQQPPRAPQPQPRPAATPEQPPKLEKWKKVETEFPEFHASLEERIAATEQGLGRKLSAIEAQQAKLDQQLQETRTIADRFQQREEREHRESARNRLDEWSPNWRKTAGWEDENGNPVPRERQAYTGEFQAWLDAHADYVPGIHARMLEDLASSDPDRLGAVFRKFDEDFKKATEAETPAGEQGNNATPRANPVVQNRDQALRDRPVRPNGGVPAPDPSQMNRPDARYATEEAEFAAIALNKSALERWRGLR